MARRLHRQLPQVTLGDVLARPRLGQQLLADLPRVLGPALPWHRLLPGKLLVPWRMARLPHAWGHHPPLASPAPALAPALGPLPVDAELQRHEPRARLRHAHLVMLPGGPTGVPTVIPCAVKADVPTLPILAHRHPDGLWRLLLLLTLRLRDSPCRHRCLRRCAQGWVLHLLKGVLEGFDSVRLPLHGAGDVCLHKAPRRRVRVQLRGLREPVPEPPRWTRVPPRCGHAGGDVRRGTPSVGRRALPARRLSVVDVQRSQHLLQRGDGRLAVVDPSAAPCGLLPPRCRRCQALPQLRRRHDWEAAPVLLLLDGGPLGRGPGEALPRSTARRRGGAAHARPRPPAASSLSNRAMRPFLAL
mmetsp:Transcript_52765/g.163993  ORF Transcript_52765/g.163993 Transcript_52765/m.163993 type:complete len:358 (+) Transcript_52765:390-1463(+)